MSVSNAQREQRLKRQNMYKQEFHEKTPSWYRGEYHLGVILAVTLGTIWFCVARIYEITVWEWLLFVPMFFVGNWVEWAAHRYILHRPCPGLRMAYKRHCSVHHQFFIDADLTYNGQKEWRALLFPPFASVGFILVAIPPALILGWLWSPNAGYLIVAQMAGYYLMYEGLHTMSHLDDAKHTYLTRLPLINTVRRMHREHHNLSKMQTTNFNLTFPICDALFGTSDLDRSFFGTLFNGASARHASALDGDALEAPPQEFYGDLEDYYGQVDKASAGV